MARAISGGLAFGTAVTLRFASGNEPVELLVPAVCEAALEHLREAGATCRAAGQWISRQPSSGFERLAFPSFTLR